MQSRRREDFDFDSEPSFRQDMMQSRRREDLDLDRDLDSQSSFGRGRRNADVGPDGYLAMSPRSKRSWSPRRLQPEGPPEYGRMLGGRRSVSVERRRVVEDDRRRIIRSRSPPYMEAKRGRPVYGDDWDLPTPERRSRYEFFNRMDTRYDDIEPRSGSPPTRNDFGYGRDSSSRTLIADNKFEGRRLDSGMREIGVRNRQLWDCTGDGHATESGGDIPSGSLNVGLGQVVKERVRYPDVHQPSYSFDKYASMKQYDDGENNMVRGDGPYSNLTASRSKEPMGGSSHLKDYERTPPRKPRVDHLGGIPLPRDNHNHPLNSADIPPAFAAPKYEERQQHLDFGRDPDFDIKEEMGRYRRETFSPPRSGNLDALGPNPFPTLLNLKTNLCDEGWFEDSQAWFMRDFNPSPVVSYPKSVVSLPEDKKENADGNHHNGRYDLMLSPTCNRSDQFTVVKNTFLSKEFLDTQRLAMHAFMSHKVGLRAQHLGLLKAICVMLGWDAAIPPGTIRWYPETLSSTDILVQKEDLIIWPPVIIVHNTSISNNDSNGQGPTNVEELGQFLRGKGLSGGKVRVGKHANCSVMLVKFLGTFSGLQEAERIHQYFAKNKHGRKELEHMSSGKGKGKGENGNGDKDGEGVVFGYMGIAEDLDKVDFDTKRKCTIKSKKEIHDIADAPVKADVCVKKFDTTSENDEEEDNPSNVSHCDIPEKMVLVSEETLDELLHRNRTCSRDQNERALFIYRSGDKEAVEQVPKAEEERHGNGRDMKIIPNMIPITVVIKNRTALYCVCLQYDKRCFHKQALHCVKNDREYFVGKRRISVDLCKINTEFSFNRGRSDFKHPSCGILTVFYLGNPWKRLKKHFLVKKKQNDDKQCIRKRRSSYYHDTKYQNISHMVKVRGSTPAGVHCGGFSLNGCRVRIPADALKPFKWKLDG
ncbi:LOW QUALITY PROTEIN: hypothetical protein OSB04_017739 [Centaurea solstitialis]|uniref:XS domain-containing protein n=1 Tax=Centaurea solstitialis TaxID=347529 RepID=A0AA38T3G4_9ASTR|nr:LOW QUALITY PROTEIN: hypothetical protein OSB04_017739 [Centaurea solstitialis]